MDVTSNMLIYIKEKGKGWSFRFNAPTKYIILTELHLTLTETCINALDLEGALHGGKY